MTRTLQLERPQLLTERVCERIRDAIIDGDLKLGEQVSEAQLAQRMGVSKTPVREALLRLKGEGLVEIHPQRGTYVFRLGPEQVARLCRFRAMVETAALREAMAERPGSLARQLALRVGDMKKAERAGDLKALARIDMDFHWQILSHCSNPYLRAGYEVIRSQLIALRHRTPLADAVDSHQVLVDAVAKGDVETACALLTEHVLDNESRYQTACGVD
ncbi:putative D-xylose utilization operon transcriptional repressor [Burkholderiaceae bacterium]|nr:putative D-xylose utilization operon transcriptional repressor [Burkholderiaceae bacterium]